MFRTTVILLGVMAATSAKGYDLDLEGFSKGDWLKVEQSYVEYRKYEAYRNAYLPDEKYWNFRGEFHTTFSAYDRLYWDTNLHMSMDDSQIRYVGLEYYLGLRIFPWLDAIKYHHSEHVLEEAIVGNKKFPVEDSYGVRVYFKK